MTRRTGQRRPRPERFRVALTDDPRGATIIPLPAPRSRAAGLVVAGMFVLFAAIAVRQVAAMRGNEVEDVFDLTTLLFEGFWVLGWSVGVLILFLLAVLLLFYRESARITERQLVHVPRLGPLKVILEYDLARIRTPRVVREKGPERARIAFTYRNGTVELGNAMPRAEAEAAVARIQEAVASVDPVTDDETPTQAADTTPVERTAPPTDTVPQEEPPWTAFSSVALIGANLVPLAGVLVLGWDLGQVMTLFWAENAVIGFYNLLKIAIVAKWGALLIGPFFLGHYGGFMAGHFMLIYYFFVRGVSGTGPEPGALAALADLFVPLWPALLALMVSHGISFRTNFLRGREYAGRTAAEQMGEPYKRIMLMQAAIIFGGWAILLLNSPLYALVLLIVLKTVVDLRAHRREHRRLAMPHPSTSSRPG